jgi:hypothetical protein
MSGRDDLRAARGAANGKPGALAVTLDEKGKLQLPPVPGAHDVAGQCAWLTAVWGLDGRHPITRGERQGLAGPDGHAELFRAGAPSIRLEPIKVVHTPARLVEAISGWATPTDGATPALKGEHCRLIAHVVRMLCGASATITAEQEATAILGTFQQCARAIEGLTTHGTGAQRFEAADALGGFDPADRELRYLVDANTGELVIRVSDLAEVARRHVGGSLPRGWLDARLSAIGFQRVTLDGRAVDGRSGRHSPHARCAVYRGILPRGEA